MNQVIRTAVPLDGQPLIIAANPRTGHNITGCRWGGMFSIFYVLYLCTILFAHSVTIPVDELGGIGVFDVVDDLVGQRKVNIQTPRVRSRTLLIKLLRFCVHGWWIIPMMTVECRFLTATEKWSDGWKPGTTTMPLAPPAGSRFSRNYRFTTTSSEGLFKFR